jgi:hypothetical protein
MNHSEEHGHSNNQVFLEECIYSIRNNILCYPTSRVLTISCVQYFGEWFGFFLLILWVYFEIYLQIYSGT